ncbi:Xylosyltransferase 2 [Pleodorina starrii]|nr:Xylosyltransferase 2 [Pleodorina starrii]
MIKFDLPQILANVSPIINNTYAAPSLVLWGAAVPLYVAPTRDAVISAARYGKGRVGIFSAESMITRCCVPPPTPPNATASDPDMDKLILNIATWASWYGWKTKGQKAVVRVSDPRYLPMVRYIVRSANRTFKNTAEAKIASYYLSTATFIHGGHQNCDLYVIGSHDNLFYDEYVQIFIANYVFHGKGLIVVGPDAMPSIFYAPDTPAVPAVQTPPPGSNEEPAVEATAAAAISAVTAANGNGSIVVRRSMQLAADVNSLPINLVITRMQLLISGVISDPGGSLLLSASQTGNALLAAQMYINYLRDKKAVSETALLDIVGTVNLARKTIPRDSPGTELLRSLLDTVSELEARRPGLPPLLRSAPSPPPPRAAPPPPRLPPPFMAPPPPPANLPSYVAYIGCFSDDPNQRLLDRVLVAGNRLVTANRCADNARALPSAALPGFFFGLQQGLSCFGAQSPSPSLISTKLPDAACDLRCRPEPGQRCGGTGSGGQVPTGRVAVALYLITSDAT